MIQRFHKQKERETVEKMWYHPKVIYELDKSNVMIPTKQIFKVFSSSNQTISVILSR